MEVWKTAFKAMPEISSPVGKGWKMVDGALEIDWCAGDILPQDLVDILCDQQGALSLRTSRSRMQRLSLRTSRSRMQRLSLRTSRMQRLSLTTVMKKMFHLMRMLSWSTCVMNWKMMILIMSHWTRIGVNNN